MRPRCSRTKSQTRRPRWLLSPSQTTSSLPGMCRCRWGEGTRLPADCGCCPDTFGNRSSTTLPPAMADNVFQLKWYCRTGVWRRGAHVRQRCGRSFSPLSSMKTMVRPSFLAFFLTPANDPSSSAESWLRLVPKRVRSVAGNSNPVAAGCARPVRDRTSRRIHARSVGRERDERHRFVSYPSASRAFNASIRRRSSGRRRGFAPRSSRLLQRPPSTLLELSSPLTYRLPMCPHAGRATSDWLYPFSSSRAASIRRLLQCFKTPPNSGGISQGGHQ